MYGYTTRTRTPISGYLKVSNNFNHKHSGLTTKIKTVETYPFVFLVNTN